MFSAQFWKSLFFRWLPRESESKIHLFLSLGGEAQFIINKKSITGKAMGGWGLEIGATLSGQVSDYALRRVQSSRN